MITSLKRFWGRWQQAANLPAAGGVMLLAVNALGQGTERKWVDAWAVSYLPTTVNGTPQAVPAFSDQTLRLNMFVKLGGTALRVKMSNRFSTQPLVIGGAHVASRTVNDAAADIVPETDHVLTFDGAKTLKLEPGKEIWSDPVDLAVRQHEDLTVSLFLPEDDNARGVSSDRLEDAIRGGGRSLWRHDARVRRHRFAHHDVFLRVGCPSHGSGEYESHRGVGRFDH